MWGRGALNDERWGGRHRGGQKGIQEGVLYLKQKVR